MTKASNSEAREIRSLTRRELMASTVSAGAALVVGAGFVMHPGEAWAAETKALSPKTMASLIQMARDVYPHDKLPDRAYAAAMIGHDEQAATDPAHKALIEEGIASLDALAAAAGHPSSAQTGWEIDRVSMLRQIEAGAFFQTIRGGMVVGLYNQKEVWGHFGYEGSSFEQGGYLDRGFDDIAWI